MSYCYLAPDNKHLIYFDITRNNQIEHSRNGYKFVYRTNFSGIIDCSIDESISNQRLLIDYRQHSVDCAITHFDLEININFIISKESRTIIDARLRHYRSCHHVVGIETTLIYYLALMYQGYFDFQMNYLFPLKYLRT